MAKSNSTTQEKSGYQYQGEVFPLPSLNKNSAFLRLARKLHRQAISMADAEQNQQAFHYRPIHIPANLLHIFTD
ncbi:MAG: hypothetical protein PHH47_13555 [Gallionella sp.]|nr:hypothetical protein [Gallionella sp.]MDD4947718.1 hypothetical protein [Gallionella sp.]